MVSKTPFLDLIYVPFEKLSDIAPPDIDILIPYAASWSPSEPIRVFVPTVIVLSVPSDAWTTIVPVPFAPHILENVSSSERFFVVV